MPPLEDALLCNVGLKGEQILLEWGVAYLQTVPW